ncbi:MAG: helix-turn-helix transcriptional regulator [Clostridia bacterium]|nr:helix-turn-helix transcriptional regulator [Clostridia bacterium]
MFGTRIALLRTQQGMSQQMLARALGVSASAVGMYEQGRREPSLQTVVKLAELFGVSTDYLLRGETILPGDLETLRRLFLLAQTASAGELVLKGADGGERAVGAEELAMTLAAILG